MKKVITYGIPGAILIGLVSSLIFPFPIDLISSFIGGYVLGEFLCNKFIDDDGDDIEW